MNDELTLHFSDEPFEPVHADADTTLQRLIANMMAKGSTEGTLTIKIDIELVQEMVDNFDPDIEGEKRLVKTPKLTHKVSSMMQMKDETKGSKMYDGYELVWDESSGEYVMRPIMTAQRTVWEADYTVTPDSSPREGSELPAALGKGAPLMLQAHTEDSAPNIQPDIKETDDPFERLLQFVGRDMQVSEAMGNYTVRANKDRSGSQAVVLSSAFSPTNRFFCSAEKLRSHVGHKVVCICYGAKDEDGNIPNPVNVSVECTDCNEVLFDVDAKESGGPDTASDGNEPVESEEHEPKEEPDHPAEDAENTEPEDMSDAFGDYPYENPAQ